MLSATSRPAALLCTVSTVALLIVCDTVGSHILPLGFEGAAALGSIAFLAGSVFAVLSMALTAFGFRDYGRISARSVLLGWSLLLILAFLFIGVYEGRRHVSNAANDLATPDLTSR